MYEFLRMPYGLCNALATFQRLMQNCLRELNLTYALIYFDDVIVFSQIEEEHLHRLRVVFGWFLEHGLKLKPSKCHFLQDEITFLGHEISADGMRPGMANLKAIAEMAPPKTYTEIQHFTGMTGFFHRFIKGYSKIAKPLNNLLEGEASKLKNEELELMPEALQAFEDLKKCMTTPILVFADFKKPFQLETDASGEGLGTILLQESDDGQYHLVAFASRELKGGEPKYHSSKLEFLALKWVVMEQFREYLQYQPFTVWTDNNPLTYILMTPNLDALGHCWVAVLARYNMKLEYLKGSDNKIADTLSWLPPEKLNEEAVAELLDYACASHKPWAERANINVIEESERVDQEVIVRYTQIVKQHKNFRNLTNLDWIEAQRRDLVIPAVINWIKWPRGDKRTLAEYLTEVASEYKKHFYATHQKEFTVQDNLLYLQATPTNSQDSTPVFVVPTND